MLTRAVDKTSRRVQEAANYQFEEVPVGNSSYLPQSSVKKNALEYKDEDFYSDLVLVSSFPG